MLFMVRANKRKHDALRDIEVDIDINKNAEGSALIKFGNTHVICTAWLRIMFQFGCVGQVKVG